jgi:hypothetical protein
LIFFFNLVYFFKIFLNSFPINKEENDNIQDILNGKQIIGDPEYSRKSIQGPKKGPIGFGSHD